MARYVQTPNIPTGAAPTSGALPQKVKYSGTPKNVLDLTFGFDAAAVPNATVRNTDKLKTLVYFGNFFGDINDPRELVQGGIWKNFKPVYRYYPEMIPGTATRDERCLHQVRADRLELILRSTLPGSSDTNPYEMGLIRLGPEHMKPGRYLEVVAKWPDDGPLAFTAWPTIWTFTGEQDYVTKERIYTNRTFECDGPDGYSRGLKLPLGESFVTGCPDGTGTPVTNVYQSNFAGLDAMGTGDGPNNPDGVLRFKTDENTDPTKGYRVWGLYFGLDGETIDMIMDGVTYRRVKVPYATKYKDSYTEVNNRPVPYSGPNPEGFLGHHVMISLQGLPIRFNQAETAAVETRPEDQKLEFRYAIKSVRMWEATITNDPPSSTVLGSLPAQTLGDLPAISSGSYVLDVSAISGAVADRFGNAARLSGDAIISATKINGLTVAEVDGSPDGCIQVTGPAVARAQGAGRFALYVVSKSRNPYLGRRQTVAQFNRTFPTSDAGKDKLSLFMGADRKYGTDWTPTGGTVVATVGGGTAYPNYADVNVLAPLPGVSPAGFTELVFGAGRDRYGRPVDASNMLFCRAVMVAIPDGGTLSAADDAAIRARLKAQWGIA